MASVYLGLGTNLGDRFSNLEKALEMISAQTNIIKLSSIYETEPVGYLFQPPFLNMACRINTGLLPQELLNFVKGIEQKMGRKPSFRNAPRLIDIDILLYDNLMIETDELMIPHPGITQRAFVLVPLNEIAPDLLFPGTHLTVTNMLKQLGPIELVRKSCRVWKKSKQEGDSV